MKNTGTSVKRVVVTLLITAFATPAFAADDIDFRSSIKKVVAESQQPTTPQAAPGKNPYKAGALGLMIGGAGIAIYGFTHTNGAKASVTDSSFSVKETKSTGVGIAGLGIAAVGGVVYAMGERKARAVQPQISFGLNRAVVGGSVSWK